MTQDKSLASDLRSFRNITSVEAVDADTVNLNLTDPDPNLAFVLASSSALAMQSSAQWDAVGEAGIALQLAGTGPYQQGKRQLGQSMSFEQVDYDQWRVSPDFTEIEMRWAPEEATRLAALMAGEAHIAALSRELGANAETNGMRVVKAGFPSTQTSIIVGGLNYLSPELDLSLPWVADIRVRQAMSKAINRQEMNDTIFGGKGEPMTVAGYHPTLSGYNPDWDTRFQEVYGYDLPAAKQLMADAGFPEGQDAFDIEGFVHVWPGVEEIPQVMAAVGIAWSELGINLTTTEVDFSALRPLYLTRTLKHAFVGTPGWRPTEVNIRVLNLMNGIIHMYEDQGLEDRYAQLADTVDPAERERLQREMGDIKFEAIELIPLFWLTRQVTVNPAVVSEWTFPGLDAGGLGHFELIKAAK
jgi:peptide/nickel transport system substrate-binding protein